MEASRTGSNPSFGIYSIISDINTQKEKNTKANNWKLIIRIILIILSFGIIIFLFIDYNAINNLFPKKIYLKIIKNYELFIVYTKIIDFFSNYYIFMIIFIFGFCQWNIYKSSVHFFGFFICQYTIFLLKLIFRNPPLLLNLDFNKEDLSDEVLDILCDYTSEFECPSFRAAYVIYSYMSFITLLFKEKKLKNMKKTKIFFIIIFVIICLIINASLILFIQSSISSIIIGSLIGFIIFFFMFNLLKIDYNRKEQMLAFLNVNIFFYILINIILFFTIFIINKIFNIKENNKSDKFKDICGESNYNYKKIDSETMIQSLSFYCNLTMIISIKIQRKLIFKNDGPFLSRNFSVEEIIEQDNLLASIKNNETYKIGKTLFIKYLCKVLLCIVIELICYLIFIILKYYRDENYIIFSILAYILPINLLVIFLFVFAKYLFIHLDLEINNDSE